MLIQRRIRGAVCLSVHPQGCEEYVREQIAYTKSQPAPKPGPRKVLIIGASTGYGLASRITAAFGYRVDTVGVFYERPADEERTASAGWYNSAFFEEEARREGVNAWSLNGDAFTDEVKKQTLELVRSRTGPVDLVIYSLAAPRRGQFTSSLRPIGRAYSSKAVNFQTGQIYESSVPPATEEEITATIAVMGGEAWRLWINALRDANLLARGAMTVAYSYIGPEINAAIYRGGTIGKAKEHLEATAREMDDELAPIGGRALVSVNKAVVTLASAAIPFVSLYIAVLYKVMKDAGTHEGCIEQMNRLFRERLYAGGPIPVDDKGRIRLDERELDPAVQSRVKEAMQKISTETLLQLSDFDGYRKELARICGFDAPGVNYTEDVDPRVRIPSLT